MKRGSAIWIGWVFLLALCMSAWRMIGSAEPPMVVQVDGEVPHPGLHAAPEGSIASAVRAAGGQGGVGVVPTGTRIVVGSTIGLARATDPFLFGRTVDINRAGETELSSVFGEELGPTILEDRLARGSFFTVSELSRVRGVSKRRVEDYAFALRADAPPRIDLNRATLDQLDALPGVGPALASRIQAERFASVDDLVKVRGVGPVLLRRVRDRVVVQ